MARRQPTWRASTAARPACGPCWTARLPAQWTWRPAITTVSADAGAGWGRLAGPGVLLRLQSPRPGFDRVSLSFRAHCSARGREHRVPGSRAALAGARRGHRRGGERGSAGLGWGQEGRSQRGGAGAGERRVGGWCSGVSNRIATPDLAVRRRTAGCLGSPWRDLKTFPPCPRTLRAAARHSSTPWKTTAWAWCSCCCRFGGPALGLSPTLSSGTNRPSPPPFQL